MSDLVSLVCAGDIRAAGRLISMIDRGEDSIEKYLPVLFPFTGNAFRIGITGPPGAGKSTLASAICRTYLDAGQSVGILAVDITSPFTGGALLGDRIRMGGLTQDARVFIRSIGNGGVPGGLSRSTRDAMRVLEAMGKDVVIVETAGVGQTDVEIAHSVDAVVLVTVPEAGDEVQALKAGILEVADMIVLNKKDRPEADGLGAELQDLVQHDALDWQVPVLRTAARTGDGVEEVVDALNAFETLGKRSGSFLTRRRVQVERELRERLRQRMIDRVDERLGELDFEIAVNEVVDGTADIYGTLDDLSRRLL